VVASAVSHDLCERVLGFACSARASVLAGRAAVLLLGSAAIVGMVTGFAVTVAWKTSGLSDRVIYELVPAFLLAGVAALAVSWLDRRVSGREGPSPASASSSAGG